MAIIALAAILLVETQLLPVAQSLSGNEALSVVRYISPGPGSAFSHYGADDSILFAVLAWVTTHVTRDFTDAAYRLWSVLPAIAAAAAMTVWLWRRVDRWVAMAFAVLAAASPVYMAVTPHVGGYGLAFLATAAGVIAADQLAQRPSRPYLVVFGVAAIVGIWSVPAFAAVAAALTAVLLLRPHLRRDVLIAAAAVLVASLAFYAPVLGSLFASAGRHYGHALPAYGFVSRPIEDLLQPSLSVLFGSVSSTAAVIACLVLLGLAAAILWRRPERMLVLVLLAPVLVAYLILDVGRFHPAPHTFSFLLAPLLVLCAVPLVEVGRLLARGRGAAAVVLVVAALVSLAVLREGERHYSRTASSAAFTPAFATQLPPQNFARAASLIRASGIGTVLTNGSSAGLDRYLGSGHAAQLAPAALSGSLCTRAAPFVYVQQPGYPASGQACLVRREAFKVRLPMLGAPIVVWFVTRG